MTRIKRPIKPKKPVLPEPPKKFVQDYVDLGGDYFSQPSVQQLLETVTALLDSPLEKTVLDKVVLNLEDFVDLYKVIEVKNPYYEQEKESYNKKLLKYNKDVASFDERMKIYETNFPVWKAWNLSQKQSLLEKEISELNNKVLELKKLKKELLNKAGQQILVDKNKMSKKSMSEKSFVYKNLEKCKAK